MWLFCSIYGKNSFFIWGVCEMTFSANRMYTLFRLFWQLHQSSPCRIQKYGRSLCHTSPKYSLPKGFQVLDPFGLKYEIYLNQTVNRMKCQELSADTTSYLDISDFGAIYNLDLCIVAIFSFHFWVLTTFWTKTWCYMQILICCQTGTCAKLGGCLPDVTEEPICLDPKVVQSCSSVLCGLSLKQLVFFHS